MNSIVLVPTNRIQIVAGIIDQPGDDDPLSIASGEVLSGARVAWGRSCTGTISRRTLERLRDRRLAGRWVERHRRLAPGTAVSKWYIGTLAIAPPRLERGEVSAGEL
jgi:hypothetical protein